MPTSAPNTDISQRADVGIGPYGASLNNNFSSRNCEKSSDFLKIFLYIWENL